MKRVLPHVFHHELESYSEHTQEFHFNPHTIRDSFAYHGALFLARVMDFFFGTRYGHRAVVLETIAAVPGIVAGMLHHLKSLRLIKDDNGLIETMLHEAENERMHLIIYSTMFKATLLERMFVVFVQLFFCVVYGFLYLISARTAHRLVGYFEELAIHSYQKFLTLVESGAQENAPAPPIARLYWGLSDDAKLKEMIVATIADECVHRDVNHAYASGSGRDVSFW